VANSKFATRICANGPAIKGGCVTRRKHRAESWYFSQKTVTVQGGYGTCFCSPGTKLVEFYECRGTKLIASHKFIPGYKFYALQWRACPVRAKRVTGARVYPQLLSCLGCRNKLQKP
jgi:hypothetical protein